MRESVPPENVRARQNRRCGWMLRCALWTAALTSALTGCQSIQSPFSGMFGGDQDDDVRRLASTDGVKGPIERLVSGRNADQSASLTPAAGREEFDKAEAAFKAKDYKLAERLAKSIAKKYKKSPVREDALFLTAEAQFMQKRYSWAQDGYDQLVKDFPSTRYLETRNKRLFTIARYWLKDPSFITGDDVQLAGFSDDGPKARVQVDPKKQPKRSYDPTRAVPILPNIHDRSRPVFDTEGRALQALRSIWTNDPTGSLADDALMLTASHYLRTKNYLEADHVFTILREEYPKSPHNSHAHLLGGFVKQASYLGPAYDGRPLDQAKQLKESTLRLYPNHPHKQRLLADLEQIEKAKAASDWDMVEFYRRKNNQKAMAVYCREIIKNYPGTPYAKKAEETLAGIPRRLQSPGMPAPPRPLQKLDDEPRLLRVPQFGMPKMPRLSLPEMPWSRRDAANGQPPASDPPGRVRF